MKKIALRTLIILLMISLLMPISLADEDTDQGDETTIDAVEGEEVADTEQQILTDFTEHVINTYGKITDTNGVKEVTNGSNVDQVQEITVEIIKGDYIGEEYTVDYVLSYDIEGKMLARELEVGDKVEVQITEDSEGNVTATVTDVSRTGSIVFLFILCLISIILVSGRRGIKTIISLLLTIAIIYFFMIKKIYNGFNAVLLSVITAIIVSFVTYFVLLGINRRSISASLGSICGILVAGTIGVIFSYSAKMTGPYETAMRLSINMSMVKFNFFDLVFAGIIISSLGACMDVALLISTHLYDIKMSNSDVEWKELFVEGMKYGKEIIGTMVNTLVLAFMGCVIGTTVLFLASDMNLVDILSKETISEYVVDALAGSMGVLYTVPLTSIIFALLNKNKVIYKRVTDNKVDGKRSLKI